MTYTTQQVIRIVAIYRELCTNVNELTLSRAERYPKKTRKLERRLSHAIIPIYERVVPEEIKRALTPDLKKTKLYCATPEMRTKLVMEQMGRG